MTDLDERKLLFDRLAAAAGKHAGAGNAPAGWKIPVPSEEGDRLARFAKAFTEAGGVFLAGPAEAALHDLGEALRAEGVTALFSPEEDGAARAIAEALAPFGPFTLTSGAEVRGGGTAVTAGFRTAEAGIAETGTIVETSAGGRTLLPGLLSDVHVSLLPAASVVDRMDEALASLFADPPRNVSFCSGPSKSADIEQTLTVGAHGPRKIIVILV
jgi:L-lactate dehydrogenase complex protein LldG